MSDKICEIFDGLRCPKCGGINPSEVSDGRHKCGYCKYKYSLKKLNDDADILSWFSQEYSPYLTAKKLGFSFNKVYYKFVKYRQEILEYADKENIPKQASIS